MGRFCQATASSPRARKRSNWASSASLSITPSVRARAWASSGPYKDRAQARLKIFYGNRLAHRPARLGVGYAGQPRTSFCMQ